MSNLAIPPSQNAVSIRVGTWLCRKNHPPQTTADATRGVLSTVHETMQAMLPCAHRIVLARLDGAIEVLLREDLEGLGPQLAARLAVRLLVRSVRGRVPRRPRGVAHHQSLGKIGALIQRQKREERLNDRSIRRT